MPKKAAQNSRKSNRKEAFRFLSIFFCLVLGFTFLVRISWIDENLILPYTKFIAWISANSFLLFGIEVESVSTFMRHPSFSVDIRRGCDGIVATLILISACIAYPSPWLKKLLGVLYGYMIIFVLNWLRVILLFGLGMMGWMKMFQFVHTYIAQFVVIASAMIFWIYWASQLRSVNPSPTVESGSVE